MDIKKPDRKALKSYFVKNAVPTASNFADLIDGTLNQKDDGFAKPPNEPLSIEADGDNTSQKKAINFYRNFADPKAAWTLSLNPRSDPANPATAKPGWNIGDADGNSKLFIDQASGNVGVGTVAPGGYRLSVNGPVFVNGNVYPTAENAGRLRVGAAWGMPGLFSGEDGAKSLALGAPAGQKVYLGESTADAFVEAGTGNAWFKGKVGIGPGANAPGGMLDVRTGGAGAWDRLVVKTTNLWGDGNTQYVTIGEGGAEGIMLHNPHVVWMNGQQRASIRMGRSNGGSYWDVGVRADSVFSFINPDLGLTALTIDKAGRVGVGVAGGAAGERLDVNGRVKAGALTMGPWPANEGGYAFIGLNTMAQSDASNYALLVGTGAETGRTFINSPVDIRFRIKNAEQMVLQPGVLNIAGNVTIGGSIGVGGKVWIRTAHTGAPYLGVRPDGSVYGGPNKQAWEAFTLEMACSRALKDNIRPLSTDEAMATLDQLAPVKYDYKGEKIFRQHVGFIAEDMPDNLATESRQSLSPFEITPILTRVAQQQRQELLAIKEKVDEAVDYSALIAPLIEAVKQQQAQIGELQAQVRALEAH
ncbi:MAG: hypothetical protein JWM26_611 [Betaproteobacteria bacterium]|nr:hypothetical protein [Betaproteobacteria bacterium]